MKQQADYLLATDEKSQQLLMWASQKSIGLGQKQICSRVLSANQKGLIREA
jgi:hypothetical protein